MGELVYGLCAVTSALCAALLVRSYRRNGGRLLLWSSLCFVFLALNNVLLFVDLVLVESVDLSLFRAVTGFVGVSLLVYGLVWEVR